MGISLPRGLGYGDRTKRPKTTTKTKSPKEQIQTQGGCSQSPGNSITLGLSHSHAGCPAPCLALYYRHSRPDAISSTVS